jgi:hypothetical protein
MRTFDAPAWLVASDGLPPDELDQSPGDDFAGRFACHLCADNRDAAERMERELADAGEQLQKAHQLLRLILRTEQRAAKREAEEPAHELALIGFACALAAIKARIEVYFHTAR